MIAFVEENIFQMDEDIASFSSVSIDRTSIRPKCPIQRIRALYLSKNECHAKYVASPLRVQRDFNPP